MSVHNDELVRYLRCRHSVNQRAVDLIFTTKYCCRLLDGAMMIREVFTSAAESLEVEILEMDGEGHVHILAAYPPKLAISVPVKNLKSTSSCYVRILNTHLRKQSNAGVLCLRSYVARSACGATLETLTAYVQSQKTPVTSR
ncbi:IS200/IS605 family transposase [Yersinia intermedia]|uniref:IS200/IS605 family transposase n=1 Tax=Yersinia intermedia TaxID=631 RepID=UPI00067C67E2|nr:IS200/IS605 family transposase [Yersinia intermedia]